MAKRRSKVHLANLAKLKKEHADEAKEKEHLSHLQDLALNRNARRAQEEKAETKRELAMQHLMTLEEKRARR